MRDSRRAWLVASCIVVVALAVGLSAVNPRAATVPKATPNVVESFGKLPLYFIENRGQLVDRVAFYLQGRDNAIYFASDGITYALTKAVSSKADEAADSRGLGGTLRTVGFRSRPETVPSFERWAVKAEFVGANSAVKPVGQDRTSAVVSYFKGPKEEWNTGLPTYSKVVYADLWPGIDLVFSGTSSRLKYDFVVKPGARPEQIRLAWRGAERLRVNEAGQLEVSTPVGVLRDDKPYAYQEVEGRRVEVAAGYEVEGEEYGFRLGAYDPSRALVIDPVVLVYAGYIGGSGDDIGYGIAVDGSGNAHVTGYTNSSEATFPETVGPDLTYNGFGEADAFVAKVNAVGTALVYAGYIGGSGDDIGYGIAVDGSGNAYVTGSTSSTEATFPVAVGPDLTFDAGDFGFVAKVNSAGTALSYAGYIGGSARGIAVDGSGNAYVTGFTSSTEATFPETVGPDLTFNGLWDAFVAKVNAAGTALVYAGYIGGSGDDIGYGIAVDGSGNAYVTGSTSSTEATFPATVGPDLTFNGAGLSNDAFVAKINAAGTALVYAGYIGGSGGDAGYGIAVDTSGNAYVTGGTDSTEATFPVTVGPDLTYNGISDAFVAKVNAAGTALIYAGYIGGSGGDAGHGIAVDGSGNAYVTGITPSTEATFPVTVGPDLTFNGGLVVFSDAFVAKVNAAGTALDYAGYIGGSGDDFGVGIAVDGSGNAYVTGWTWSTETSFPVTVGPDLTHNGGGVDAFVAKIAVRLKCDADKDGDIDTNDINAIVAARNTAASGPNDLRDFDGDGFITVNDARKCVLQCTKPRCLP